LAGVLRAPSDAKVSPAGPPQPRFGLPRTQGGWVYTCAAGGQRGLHHPEKIVELKRTLRPESLAEAQEQLCASRVRLEVVCAFLGLPLTSTILWIGAERNLLDGAAAPDLAPRKARIGGSAPPTPTIVPATVDLPIGGTAALHVHALPSPRPLTPAPAPTPPPARPPAAPA
jgi:hypothetical protein